MVDVDEKLVYYVGEDDLIKEAFERTGILIDFSQVFSKNRFQLKEREIVSDPYVSIIDMMNALMQHYKGQPEKQFELYLMDDRQIRMAYGKLKAAQKELYK